MSNAKQEHEEMAREIIHGAYARHSDDLGAVALLDPVKMEEQLRTDLHAAHVAWTERRLDDAGQLLEPWVEIAHRITPPALWRVVITGGEFAGQEVTDNGVPFRGTRAEASACARQMTVRNEMATYEAEEVRP